MSESRVNHLTRREIYCRHNVDCQNSKKAKARNIFGCRCPIYARVLIRHPVTKTEIFRFDGSVTKLGLTTKIAVESVVESWVQKALQGDDPLATPKTVAAAVEAYLNEKEKSFRGRMKEWHKGKSLSIRKYADVLNPLSGFIGKTYGLKYLMDVQTEHLSKYLESRPGRKLTDGKTGYSVRQPKSALSLQKEQENIKQFFKRCRQLRYITYDPAEALLPITVNDEGADPLTLEEKARIVNLSFTI